MKIIGLVGGMSWESTASYYRIINNEVKFRLGGLHSAKIIVYSVDFHDTENLQRNNRWKQLTAILTAAAHSLERAGADCVLLCSNTVHKVAEAVSRKVQIPLLHIVDITAKETHSRNFKTVGLLGTGYIMEQDFYKIPFIDKDIQLILPDKQDREIIHNIIFQELCIGITTESAEQKFLKIFESMRKGGAEAIILACTEIALLLKPEKISIPILDSARIHAMKAVDYALEN